MKDLELSMVHPRSIPRMNTVSSLTFLQKQLCNALVEALIRSIFLLQPARRGGPLVNKIRTSKKRIIQNDHIYHKPNSHNWSLPIAKRKPPRNGKSASSSA